MGEKTTITTSVLGWNPLGSAVSKGETPLPRPPSEVNLIEGESGRRGFIPETGIGRTFPVEEPPMSRYVPPSAVDGGLRGRRASVPASRHRFPPTASWFAAPRPRGILFRAPVGCWLRFAQRKPCRSIARALSVLFLRPQQASATKRVGMLRFTLLK